MRPAPLAAAALGLVLLAYVGSLDGGWVWDDHVIIAANPALDSLSQTLRSDVFGPATGTRSDMWRPLAMLSYLPGHLVGWGPSGERILSLVLHLLATAALALAGRGAGADWPAAWLGALLFGVHPASAELVAWLSGRHDQLALGLLIGATAAWLHQRPWLAGLLLALAPFCKESFLVVPAVALLWALGRRRLHPALALPVVGAAAVLLLRQSLAMPIGSHVFEVGLLGPLGGATARLLRLLAVPTAADALPLFAPRPVLGALALLLGLALGLLSWGRPRLAAVTGLLLPVLPGALAMAHSGLASDRYLVPALAALGLGLAAALGSRRLSPLLALLPLLLALATGLRARDWRSDQALFTRSLARDPANAHAAFHLGHDLHTRQDDCAAAIPLYRRGLSADPRAGTNLLACLVSEGRLDEALAEGPAIAGASDDPKPAAALARAAALAGDPVTALQWAEQAVQRDPQVARNQVLLGKLRAQAGDWSGAEAAFQRALELEPGHSEARSLLEKVRAAGSEAAP